jgi:hypothetical protein
MLYWVHLAWVGLELTMLVVIGTDCIGSSKSNYHMYTTMTVPWDYLIKQTSVNDTYQCVVWSFQWNVPICHLVISMIRTNVSSGHFNDTYHCVVWSFLRYVPICRLVISMIRTIVSSGHFNDTYHVSSGHFNDTYHCVIWSFLWYVPLCRLVISMIRTNVSSGHFNDTYHCAI